MTFAAAALLPFALSGCPLTDDYFIEPDRGQSGTAPIGGEAGLAVGGSVSGAPTSGSGAFYPGAGGSAGSPAGGARNGGSGGATAGTESGGSAGSGGASVAGSSQGGAGLGGSSDSGGEPAAGAGGEPAQCEPVAEICDGVSNDCDEEIDEDDACPSGCAIRVYDGHSYLLCLIATQATWQNYTEASARCAAAGEEFGSGVEFALSRVESAGENDFIKNWIAEAEPSEGMVWMGANDLDEEGTWVWGVGVNAEHFFDGAALGGGTAVEGYFNDFAAGRPNSANEVDEDCGAFDSDVAWQWNDLKCSEGRLGYVCEQAP